MRKCMYMGVALMISLAVAACGGGKGQSSGSASTGSQGSSKPYAELKLGALDWAGALSTQTSGWIPTYVISALAVQRLVAFEPDGKLKLELANSVEHPSQTTYIYHIRPGVKFSDGKPLTAADVVYSLELNQAKEALQKSRWEDVASVAARGNSAVIVTLKQPNVDWPSILAYSSMIFEKAPTEKAGGLKALGTPSDLPVGTGPWKIDSFTPDVSVQLSRNPYWYGPLPPTAKISVTLFKEEAAMALALRSGAIDAATYYENAKLFESIPGVRSLLNSQNFFDFLIMNTNTPPLNNVHVRRAISYATNVSGMLKVLYPGGIASRPSSIAPNATFADLGTSEAQVSAMLKTLPQYEFNLAAARRELAKSPYPHGFTTEVRADVNEPPLVQASQVVAADLAKIGITAKVRSIPNDEWANMYGSKVKLLLNEIWAYYPEPDAIPAEILATANIDPPGDGTNWAGYRNDEIERLLNEQVTMVNPGKRLQAIGKILKLTATEQPYMPLFEHDSFIALSNKYVDPTWSFYTSYYTPWAMAVKPAH